MQERRVPGVIDITLRRRGQIGRSQARRHTVKDDADALRGVTTDVNDSRLRNKKGPDRNQTLSSAWCARRDSNRSEEHTSELQSLMRISYAVFCLKKKNQIN